MERKVLEDNEEHSHVSFGLQKQIVPKIYISHILFIIRSNSNRLMRKPVLGCLGILSLVSKHKLFLVLAQAGLCLMWSKTQRQDFIPCLNTKFAFNIALGSMLSSRLLSCVIVSLEPSFVTGGTTIYIKKTHVPLLPM